MEKQKSQESSKSSRKKVSEKTSTESHRQYLDMDTDEEEFGRQETPEPQDETPPEPEKPKFTEEELHNLVEQTRNLTVLPNLTESSWTESCLERIREYFCDPSNLILTIYFSGKKLRALLDFPDKTDDGLAYFLRTTPWQVYRPNDSLTFGSVSGRIESTIFKFVDVLYAPLAFRSEWPKIMRDEIFSNIHDFLTRAMEVSFRPMGMLVLYVPWEGTRLKQPKQQSSLEIKRESGVGARCHYQQEQRLLIDRLEKVARSWIKQIRESLIIFPKSPEKLYDVTSEFQFWKNRYENLSCISLQLQSERFLVITDQLKRVRSSSVDNLKKLSFQVNEALEEAKSNLMYLDILVDHCRNFDHPGKVQDCLPEILYVVRFIRSESPYYNASKNTERLLCSLSVRIIKVCDDSVDLKLLFDDAKKCQETIKISLACLLSYSQIYDQIVGNCEAKADNWKVDRITVFNNVGAFEQRCHDVSEICEAIKIYGSSSKVNFGGTRGNRHDAQYRRIKDNFSQIMNGLRFICDYALDITEIKWFQAMSKFRCELDQLENTTVNLLNGLFEDVVSVEMGIETLYTLFKFRERQRFANILRNKWTQVWKMFSDEIELSSKDSIEHVIYQDRDKLLQSEHSVISIINEEYLKRLYKMMIDASDWLGDCDLQSEPPLINFSRKMSSY